MSELNHLLQEFQNQILTITDIQSILTIKNQYLDHLCIQGMYKKINKLSNEEKGKIIKLIKEYKHSIETKAKNRIELLQSYEETIDCSLTVRNSSGFLHPMTVFINRIKTILYNLNFKGLRFQEESSSEIESAFYNFEALNVPELHPCRTDHQSFFIDRNKILRTQSTATTAHIIEKYKEGNGAFFALGKTYRKDSDATHLPQFHQLDILVIHEKANFPELLSFLQLFLNTLFEESLQYRFRPSHFPFTNFSTEVDIWFNGRWLEVLGSGIIHSRVFEECKSNYRMAFAAGIGIERLLMIKYNITDIWNLYEKIEGFTHISH